jgi:hypothetical protein
MLEIMDQLTLHGRPAAGSSSGIKDGSGQIDGKSGGSSGEKQRTESVA